MFETGSSSGPQGDIEDQPWKDEYGLTKVHFGLGSSPVRGTGTRDKIRRQTPSRVHEKSISHEGTQSHRAHAPNHSPPRDPTPPPHQQARYSSRDTRYCSVGRPPYPVYCARTAQAPHGSTGRRARSGASAYARGRSSPRGTRAATTRLRRVWRAARIGRCGMGRSGPAILMSFG